MHTERKRASGSCHLESFFFLNGPNRLVKEIVTAVVRTELGELSGVQDTHPSHRRISSELGACVRACKVASALFDSL